MVIRPTSKQTQIENLSKWLLDQAHRAHLSDKQFNSLLVISRARFGRDIPSLLLPPMPPPILTPDAPRLTPAKRVRRRRKP